MPTLSEQWGCARLVLLSHFTVELPQIWLFHPLAQYCGLSTSVPFPSLLTMAYQIAIFFVLEDTTQRDVVLVTLAELRRAGVSADLDYAGRSFKGQMTQAGRSGARTVVIVRGDGAVIRRDGGAEQLVALDEVVATLTA